MSFSDDIQIPLLTVGMKDGLFLKWLVNEGDRVQRGEVLYELETAEGIFEIENFQTGIVRRIETESARFPVGHVVGVIEFTELERIDSSLGVDLNYDQRQVLDSLRGEMDAHRWIINEFKQFITNKLSGGEDPDASERTSLASMD